MGTLLECLREARLEKYYPSFRAQGVTRSETLTRLTVNDCSSFGINAAEDRRRFIQLIEVVKQVHSEGPYGASGNSVRTQQIRSSSARKRNRSPAVTQNSQVSGRSFSTASDVRVHERSRINASSHHLSGAGAAILDLISDDDSTEGSSSGSEGHSDYEPAVKHSVTTSVSRTSPPRLRKTPVEKVKHGAGYNYGVPGGSAQSSSKPKSRGSSRMGEEKIKVCVRKRPLSGKEIKSGEEDMTKAVSTTTLTVSEPKQAVDLTAYTLQHEFMFDEVFDEKCTNEDVYIRAARPLINCLFDGGSATCFAYGQTGAGKTHTMIGGREVPGLYLLAAHDIFSIIQSRQYGSGIRVWVSFFEIYCGQLFDLLNRRNRLFAREDGSQRVCIAGLTETETKDETSLMQVLEYGNAVRSKGATGVNPDSSRSHAVLQLEIRDKQDKRLGRISFIDLAGSERASDSTDTDKQTRMEGAEINQSLLAIKFVFANSADPDEMPHYLKECIRSIDQESRHKPFRQSKLTHILKDSFIGNSRTCMIANISPAKSSCEHTLNTLRYADRVKELRRATASTSRSVNVAMSNILMNIPASAPSLFQPSNILCSSTPMRQSTKQFTNRGSELNLDPSETPIRGPGARRKTSSAASKDRNSSANASVNKSVNSSRVSVVRHVAPQVSSNSGAGKQNTSSNSESDQTDTDSNNITGPQKPINIAVSAHGSNFKNSVGINKNNSNIPSASMAPQNIPVVKSTDTENDFPTTDFNDELNDLNRTGDKQTVASSVPAFKHPLRNQTDSQEADTENKRVSQYESNQYSAVSASVPVLRQKMYSDRQTDLKPSPMLSDDAQNEVKPKAVRDYTNQSGKQALTTASSNVPKSKEDSAYSAYFSQGNRPNSTSERTPINSLNDNSSRNAAESVRSEISCDSSEKNTAGRIERKGIPSLTEDSIDDDMLFDSPSLTHKHGFQRTLSDQSGGFLSPPSTRTTPRVPQDPSMQPEIPAVLPAKSSDLTTFSQRSPRWFLQNQTNNGNMNQQRGFRPEPPKVDDINSGLNRYPDSDKHADRLQALGSDKTNNNTPAKHDALLEKRLKAFERYASSNDAFKQTEKKVVKSEANRGKMVDNSCKKLETNDKLAVNKGYLAHGDKEERKEPISADWFLTPADHDTHLAASVTGSKTSSGKGPVEVKVNANKIDSIGEDETDLKKGYSNFRNGSSPVPERSINKSGYTKSDTSVKEEAQRGYASDSCVRPKTIRNGNVTDKRVSSPQTTVKQALNNSPVFKDIISVSPVDLRSNSPLSHRTNSSSSPLGNRSGNSAIKTEKVQAGAVFSPIHPQPVTTAGVTKSTIPVSKDIVHPTPVTKMNEATGRSNKDSEANSGSIDLRSQLISSHEDQLATVTSLCKQEMKLLLGAKAGNKSFDDYMKKVGDILSQKLSAIQLLQDQIIAYQLSLQDT